MALGPINYQMQVATPFESVLQGMRVGAQMADIEAARQQRAAQVAAIQQKMALEQQAADRAARQQEVVSRLVGKVRDGTWTEADFVEAQAFAPKDQADALNRMWSSMSEGARKKMLAFGTNVLVAAGRNPEVAKQLVRDRAEAERNSGRPDQAKAYEDWIRTLDLATPEEVQATVGGLLSGLEGGKDALAAWKSSEEEFRKKQTAPLELRKIEADVKKAEIELETLGKIKEAELRKAVSEADKLAVEARFAERLKQADLNLKAAQTAASRASAAKAAAETEDLVRKATEGPLPEYNAQAGGFIIKPSKGNPTGGFIPLPQVQNVKDQQAAVKALKTAGYDPETGEDTISKLIERSTSGGTQALATSIANKIGFSPTGGRAIRELAAAASSIATDMLGGKLGAGISNTDRDFIVAGLGSIADPTIPYKDRLAAWGSVKNRLILTGVLPPPTRRPGSRPPAPAPAPGREAETPAIDALLEKYRD